VEQVLEELEAKERERRRQDSQTTPLLQFMRDRKDEKIRKREEQRENRRRKEEERKRRLEEERQRRKEIKEKEIRQAASLID
jgi:regulator of nonsense transcripts 3